jgi:hypothetical protein
MKGSFGISWICFRLLPCLLFLFIPACLALRAQAPATNKTDNGRTYVTGGVSVEIPAPWPGTIEMGPDNRPQMNRFVPPYNRLIAAFVPSNEIDLANDKTPSRIALIAVSREYESRRIEETDFNLIVDGVRKQFDSNVESYAKENEEEFNKRLKSLNLDSIEVTFEKPISLGTLFSLPGAAGFGTILQVSANNSSSKPESDVSLTKALSVLFVRVKDRVVFAYIFADYKDQETAKWLRKASEDWCSEILKENKE